MAKAPRLRTDVVLEVFKPGDEREAACEAFGIEAPTARPSGEKRTDLRVNLIGLNSVEVSRD
jgi:hypothetical protein